MVNGYRSKRQLIKYSVQNRKDTGYVYLQVSPYRDAEG